MLKNIPNIIKHIKVKFTFYLFNIKVCNCKLSCTAVNRPHFYNITLRTHGKTRIFKFK